MLKSLTSAIVACLLTASAASADVQVLLNNGRVSIVAKDATVRQILAEWARVGQTKVVNVDRIPGGPLTLELSNVPEGQALDVLLRSVSGYMAAPRQTVTANLSMFDRIIVMPTTAAPRPAAAAQAPAFQQPQFQQPVQQPVDDDADDQPPPNVQAPNQPRGPVFNTFPPPQVGAPQQAPSMTPGMVPVVPGAGQTVTPPATFGATPTMPASGGVAVPGMMTPNPTASPGAPPPTIPTRPGGRGGQ
jgi:hypothetical protein